MYTFHQGYRDNLHCCRLTVSFQLPPRLCIITQSGRQITDPRCQANTFAQLQLGPAEIGRGELKCEHWQNVQILFSSFFTKRIRFFIHVDCSSAPLEWLCIQMLPACSLCIHICVSLPLLKSKLVLQVFDTQQEVLNG